MIIAPLVVLIIGITTGVTLSVNEPKVEKFGKQYLAGEKASEATDDVTKQ